jgi:hypothetical protein
MARRVLELLAQPNMKAQHHPTMAAQQLVDPLGGGMSPNHLLAGRRRITAETGYLILMNPVAQSTLPWAKMKKK